MINRQTTARQIVIGISDLNVAEAPDELISYALGSCVGICLYDPARQIAGLAHILLPDSTEYKDIEPKKFADTAIKMLLDTMLRMGCRKSIITARIAGGANMFAWQGETIGDKNVNAVKKHLAIHGIPITASDVGGSHGRTVSIDSLTGKVMVKSLSAGTKIL